MAFDYSGLLGSLDEPFGSQFLPTQGSAGSLSPGQLGLLSAGLGILANNTGHYGAFGPAIGRGGLLGLQGYPTLPHHQLLVNF